MRELNFVNERLQEMAKEMGVSNHSGFIEGSLRKVNKLTGNDVFYSDIFLHSACSVKCRSFFEYLTGNASAEYHFEMKDENSKTHRVFEQIFPAVALVGFDETMNNAALLKEIIANKAHQYRLVIIINYTTDELATAYSRTFKYPTRTLIFTPSDDENITADDFFKKMVPEPTQLIKLKRFTYSNSLQPLFPSLDQVFNSENRIAQTRKLLNNQNVQISRKDEMSANQSELMNNLKQMVMKFTQEADKAMKLKYDDLNKPVTGKFSQIGQEQVSAFTEFEKEQMAEKNEKVLVTLHQDQVKTYMSTISHSIEKELKNDKDYLNVCLDDLILKINGFLQSKKLPALKKEEIEVGMPESKRVLSSYCYMSRTYSGEMVKKGATEYFVALRDYIGVIMVATGLLAPLNMIASLGDEKDSVFSFLKHLNKIIKFGTASICICLIIYGIYDLRKRIPRKREEEFKREMSKAKELLLSEAKRMFSESSRDWTTNLASWTKDVSQNIIQQLERTFRQFQNEKQQSMNSEKMLQQRQQQGIDMIIKNIQSAERVKEQLSTKFREFSIETEKDFKI